MAVVSDVSEIKLYLELDHDGDDALLQILLDDAHARLRGFVNTRIDDTEDEFTEYHNGGSHRIFLRNPYIDEETIIVTDTKGTKTTSDDETLDSTLWRIQPETGILMRTTANGGRLRFASGLRRWKVVYDGGLDKDPLWTAVILPDLADSVKQLVAHLYENRNPGAETEKEGDISTKTRRGQLPDRVQETWAKYAIVAVAG